MTLVIKTDGLLPTSEAQRASIESAGAQLLETACLTEDAMIEACADADALLVLREPVTARVIAALTKCRIISRFGIGVDTIDVDAATRAGIVIGNVPDSSIDEVSTHAVAMILHHLRRLGAFDTMMRGGGWQPMPIAVGMKRSSAQTVGLLGFGHIGQQTARKLAPFGFRLQVYDPYVGDTQLVEVGAERVDLETLITTSDVVSLHVPLTDETRSIMDRAALGRMKPGAIIVNVSRGGLIDEDALAEALIGGHIGGAGLDTFAQEPLPASSALLGAPRVLLSPHVAHYTDQSLVEMMDKAFANVAAVLSGGTAPYQLNKLGEQARGAET